MHQVDLVTEDFDGRGAGRQVAIAGLLPARCRQAEAAGRLAPFRFGPRQLNPGQPLARYRFHPLAMPLLLAGAQAPAAEATEQAHHDQLFAQGHPIGPPRDGQRP